MAGKCHWLIIERKPFDWALDDAMQCLAENFNDNTHFCFMCLLVVYMDQRVLIKKLCFKSAAMISACCINSRNSKKKIRYDRPSIDNTPLWRLFWWYMFHLRVRELICMAGKSHWLKIEIKPFEWAEDAGWLNEWN